MNQTPEELVRLKLGQEIPVGGADTDTMFTDAQIEDFLELGNDDVNAATYWGWDATVAKYAHLVTVSEGNASREMTELHRNALRMRDRYNGYITTPGRGRARIGRLVRDGSPY